MENGERVNWFALILIGLGLIVMVVATVSAIWGFGVITAGIKGRGEAVKRTQSVNFRLTAYEGFFDRCAAIQASEDALDAQATAIEGAETTRERTRIRANIAGIQSQRAQNITRYNADARKWTRGQFLAEDLPFKIDDAPYPEGGKTSCGS